MADADPRSDIFRRETGLPAARDVNVAASHDPAVVEEIVSGLDPNAAAGHYAVLNARAQEGICELFRTVVGADEDGTAIYTSTETGAVASGTQVLPRLRPASGRAPGWSGKEFLFVLY
jgi:hypothetical protein